MISIRAQRNTMPGTRADILVQFIFEDPPIFRRQVQNIGTVLGNTAPLKVSAFQGTDQETLSLYPEKARSKRLLLVGLGKSEKLTREKLRRAAATAAKSARSQKAKTIAFMEPEPDVLDGLKTDFGSDRWLSVGLALSEGAVLALYRFDPYLTEKKKNLSPKELILVSSSSPRLRALQKGLKLARVLCESTYLARDLENAPGNEIFPESLSRRAAEAGRSGRFTVAVYDERKIRRLRMGGLLGVGQGSDRPPRLITMEYRPRRKRRQPTIVLVGKGVTFDSGGISIKPATNMAEMKMDMSGAAAVIGTMLAAARLRLPVHLVGLIPAAENLLGGAALKPGDIITHYNGKTSEIDNTDAEGRLILADALSYASRYKPDVVIDLATLTGACVVALGHHATGMMGNNQEVMDRLKESGERTHERVWQLPMFEEYEKLIKSDIADVKNVGGRWAGAITGAMFLKKFIGNYRWVHLDIAGTAILEESLDYIPKGGSGVGVRLLVDLLQNWK